MADETATCQWEAVAGDGNDAGHALMHTMESAAVMSVAQSFRTAATAAASAVLVTFLFTRNWWVFAGLALLVLVDIYVHTLVLRAEKDTATWINYTLELTKRITAKHAVADVMVKHYHKHSRVGGSDS